MVSVLLVTFSTLAILYFGAMIYSKSFDSKGKIEL